ncbi:MAG: hypothetical protein Q9162_005399 [Coniocarpon cinnabarinum]
MRRFDERQQYREQQQPQQSPVHRRSPHTQRPLEDQQLQPQRQIRQHPSYNQSPFAQTHLQPLQTPPRPPLHVGYPSRRQLTQAPQWDPDPDIDYSPRSCDDRRTTPPDSPVPYESLWQNPHKPLPPNQSEAQLQHNLLYEPQPPSPPKQGPAPLWHQLFREPQQPPQDSQSQADLQHQVLGEPSKDQSHAQLQHQVLGEQLDTPKSSFDSPGPSLYQLSAPTRQIEPPSRASFVSKSSSERRMDFVERIRRKTEAQQRMGAKSRNILPGMKEGDLSKGQGRGGGGGGIGKGGRADGGVGGTMDVGTSKDPGTSKTAGIPPAAVTSKNVTLPKKGDPSKKLEGRLLGVKKPPWREGKPKILGLRLRRDFKARQGKRDRLKTQEWSPLQGRKEAKINSAPGSLM